MNIIHFKIPYTVYDFNLFFYLLNINDFTVLKFLQLWLKTIIVNYIDDDECKYDCH